MKNAEEVLVNCDSLYLSCHSNAKMHVYMIASSTEIIHKYIIFAMCQFKSARIVSC